MKGCFSSYSQAHPQNGRQGRGLGTAIEERFQILFRNQANIHLLWHYNLN